MEDKLLLFLEYMRDDYLELCETEFVHNDEEFPFTITDLVEIREKLEELILERRE